MSINVRPDTSSDNEFVTLKQMAIRMRVSPDTVRRQRISGKLDEVEWIDFFGNGRVRATTKSFEAFLAKRAEATRKVYNQSVQKTRPS